MERDLLEILPIDRYMELKSPEISASFNRQKVIYLDMKYWLVLRDQARADYPCDKEMLYTALKLVDENRCIFVVSETTYYETLKQRDEKSRNETLAIIQRLSKGISLVDSKARTRLEFLHWLAIGQQKETLPLKRMVWAKLPLVILYPLIAMIGSLTDSKIVQDKFFDDWSAYPLDTLRSNEYLQAHPVLFKDNVKDFNDNKERYKYENKTFSAMFLSELGGLLIGCKPEIEDAMSRKHFEDRGRFFTKEEKQGEAGATEWCSLIYQCFKQNKTGKNLPLFRICASIYSSFRWNKERKYKDGNDTMDVMHACAALPYCDYFFTENELHTIISQQKLDELYGCLVASKPGEILSLLKSI